MDRPDVSIFKALLERRRIAAFSEESEVGQRWVLARVGAGETPEIAKESAEREIKASGYDGSVEVHSVWPEFHLLSTEFRPGSGIIRRVDGRPKGPAGGLTCFLSSRSGDELYFLSAAHVLTNYWRGLVRGSDRRGSIYRNIKGFPDAESQLFAGKLFRASELPPHVGDDSVVKGKSGKGTCFGHVTLDAGIAKLENGFIIRQRTTCYGSFHELLPPGDPERLPEPDTEVIKCGPEEPHETSARVMSPNATVEVVGPKGERYLFSGQIVLGPPPEKEKECAKFREENLGIPTRVSASQNSSLKFAFAAAGDSGTIVVEKKTKAPIGMLVAGSILSGMYLVTPIGALKEFWEKEELIFRRG